MKNLRNLGERKIISEVISKYCSAEIGDDCADIQRENESIIVTMDPVPPPAAEVIAGDIDPYWKGRLLVTINASDLAAAAAEPLAFFVGVDALPEMLVADFERFFKGVRDGCNIENLNYAGGNIREGKLFSAIGTAIGVRNKNLRLGRKGAKVGTGIAVVGQAGQFWLDALRAKNGDKSIVKEQSPLFAPLSKSKEMRALAAEGFIECSMDNSDGLLSSISQLAITNGLGALIDLEAMTAPKEYEKYASLIGKVSHQRLWMGWGDWNVVIGFDLRKKMEIERICSINGFDFTHIGEFISGKSVLLTYGGETKVAPRVESERFAEDSWFSAGIEGYINLLKTVDLPGDL